MLKINFSYFLYLIFILSFASCSNDEEEGIPEPKDTINPTITCVEPINVIVNIGTTETRITYSTPVGKDNLPGAITEQTSGLASGSLFPIGTTTNTFIVTDAAGNTVSCSFDVTVATPSEDKPFSLENGVGIPTGKKWTKVENLSDEFNNGTFDDSKWHRDPATDGFGWIGRPPGLFEADNVSVSDGNLNVTTLKYQTPKVVNGKNFTHGGAIIRSKNSGGVGNYYECRMKANKTVMSSTFWLAFKENCPRKLELDIQECVGRVHSGTDTWANNFDNIYHSNIFLHKRTCNGVTNEEKRSQKGVTLTEKNYSRYFVYGCWWKSETEILFYLDGEYSFTLTPPTNYDIEGFITMAIETYDWNPIDPNSNLFETGSFDDLSTKYDWVRTWKLEDK
ncbi:HYR domain-containing protein [Lutibacter agarilyticus]|uniref:HYR domain-containing protein n=1 Tax=Lutibacter agarilyticus TaxID=1109740 RepID=A0A238XAW8_9FLAO|nr:HYR domain-containing protein [Lutibacter agarilyticus]SNR55762.1 HYR domain-containing protein [Lutibacter agarilyticus]